MAATTEAIAPPLSVRRDWPAGEWSAVLEAEWKRFGRAPCLELWRELWRKLDRAPVIWREVCERRREFSNMGEMDAAVEGAAARRGEPKVVKLGLNSSVRMKPTHETDNMFAWVRFSYRP